MTTQGSWRVTSNNIDGKTMYGVFRPLLLWGETLSPRWPEGWETMISRTRKRGGAGVREMTLTQAIAHAEQVAEWLRELTGARARIERLEAALREIVAEAASDEGSAIESLIKNVKIAEEALE